MKLTPETMNSQSHKLLQTKCESYDCAEESSLVELDDVRKLDSLLTQCESISCDNIMQHQDVFHYQCSITERKYSSTSELYGNVSKSPICRQGSKKLNLFLEDRRLKENKLKKVKSVVETKEDMATSLQLQTKQLDDETSETKCCLCSETSETYENNYKKLKTLDCLERSCLCETSLTVASISQNAKPSITSSITIPNNFTRKPVLPTKQNTTTEPVKSKQNKDNNNLLHPLEALATIKNVNSDDNNSNHYKSVDILRVPSNLSQPRKSAPDIKNKQHDTKSVKSEISMRKANLKFWKFNSEDDGAGGVKESLLGSKKSVEKKMPEQVETVSLYI